MIWAETGWATTGEKKKGGGVGGGLTMGLGPDGGGGRAGRLLGRLWHGRRHAGPAGLGSIGEGSTRAGTSGRASCSVRQEAEQRRRAGLAAARRRDPARKGRGWRRRWIQPDPRQERARTASVGSTAMGRTRPDPAGSNEAAVASVPCEEEQGGSIR